MKKVSTFVFFLMVCLGMQAAVTTAWEGSEAVSWSNDIPGTQYETTSGIFDGLEAGDVINVYTHLTGDYGDPQYVMTYKAGDGWEWTDLVISVSDEGVITYTVASEQIATEIAQRGLIFRGQAYTITKITFGKEESSEPLSQEKDVWTGSEAISWNGDIPGTQFETPEGTFANLQKGDIIRFYTQPTEGDYGDPQYNVTYKAGDGWEWTELSTTVADGIISYTVENEQIATEIAERGLIMRGQAYTLLKISIETPATETPDEPTPDEPANDANEAVVCLTLATNATGTASQTDDTTGNTVMTSISEGTVTVMPTAGTGFSVKSVKVEKLTSPANADGATLSAFRAAPAIGNYSDIVVTDNSDGTYSFIMPENNDIRILTVFQFTFLAPTLNYNGQTHVVNLTDANEQEKDHAAKMYYSIDEKQTWTMYDEPFVINKNTTVWTKAVTTTNFETVSESSQIFHVANVPTFSYENGVNTVTITLQEATADYTAGTAIYYTLDGSDPTLESSIATSGEPVNYPITTTVVKAMAVDADGNWSAVVEQAVEYARYLTVDKQWVTFYSPETFAVPEGLKAYTVSEIQYNEGEEGTMVLTEQQHIVANVPMLIENASAGTTDVYRIYNSEGTISGTVCTEFKGTSENMDIDASNKNIYVLVDGVFLRSKSGTLAAHNCYLELESGSVAAQARSFRLVGGSTDGIGQVNSLTATDGVWYSLGGIRVSKPASKGIYLHNGRKVIVK